MLSVDRLFRPGRAAAFRLRGRRHRGGNGGRYRPAESCSGCEGSVVSRHFGTAGCGMAVATRFSDRGTRLRSARSRPPRHRQGQTSHVPYGLLAPGKLVLNAGRPVLYVPDGVATLGADHVVIGWKNTREARRAVVDALPLLRKAARVSIVEVHREKVHFAPADVNDLIRYLARHRIAAEPPRHPPPRGFGCGRSDPVCAAPEGRSARHGSLRAQPARRMDLRRNDARRARGDADLLPVVPRKRDGFWMNYHRALASCLDMTFSENRFTLFRPAQGRARGVALSPAATLQSSEDKRPSPARAPRSPPECVARPKQSRAP